MEIDKIMRQYDFKRLDNDDYYVKDISYDGEPAVVSITGLKACGAPETLDDPIMVMMYDNDFNEIRKPIALDSLRTFICSLKGDSVLYRQRFEESSAFPMLVEKSGYICLCRCVGSPWGCLPDK